MSRDGASESLSTELRRATARVRSNEEVQELGNERGANTCLIICIGRARLSMKTRRRYGTDGLEMVAVRGMGERG